MDTQQKAIKGLKFGGHQSSINASISTGVVRAHRPEQLHNVPNPRVPLNNMKQGKIIEE